MSITRLKHPLGAPMKAGIDNLKRLGLNTESSANADLEEARQFSDVIVSTHAPWTVDGMRLNYAATDEAFRRRSLDIILRHIDDSRTYPNLKQVNIHPPPKQWLDDEQTEGREGDYNLMIDAMRQVADYAAGVGVEIVVENLIFYYTDIPEDTSPDQIDWSSRNLAFGAEPQEWLQICEDVDRPNLALCLDSSHACTYAHTIADPDRRAAAVMEFVSRPELIKHVHWNDNYLYDIRGRDDSHAVLGKGSMPTDLHRAIKGLNATLFLEHFYSIEELEEELDFIDRL